MKILIVEDNTIVAENLAFWLNQIGCPDTTIVTRPGKALDRIAQELFEGLVLDWQMPLERGREGAREQLAAHFAKALVFYSFFVMDAEVHPKMMALVADSEWRLVAKSMDMEADARSILRAFQRLGLR